MEDPYTDEYVAEALKADAKSSSIKYSALALLPQRPIAAPKPNTRFLRNVIRDTDTHNAALLAKERREARDRERELRRRKGATNTSSGFDTKYSSNHDSQADRLKSPRKRTIDDRQGSSHGRSRSPAREDQIHTKHREDHRSSRRRIAESKEADVRKKYHHREHDGKKTHRSHRRRGHRDSSQSRSRSGERRRSRRTDGDADDTFDSNLAIRERSSKRSRPSLETKEYAVTKHDPKTEGNSDSDPLDAIIGPLPPRDPPATHSRGRGALRGATNNMDAHFVSSYDPAVDVQPNSESEDDWAQALEGLRDRQKWMQKGAERMREAGFTDAQVKKWENGGEKKEGTVRWAKKGESREWDKGKHMDLEGEMGFVQREDSTWGRLKGT